MPSLDSKALLLSWLHCAAQTYTFFYADSGISAARSSMGGLSLLLRNPPKTQLFW